MLQNVWITQLQGKNKKSIVSRTRSDSESAYDECADTNTLTVKMH